MGQQQLLLLVLATVVVGLATVAGIQAFDRSQKQFDRDARRQVAIELLSDFKGLLSKPSEVGGVDLEKGDEGSWSGGHNEVDALHQLGYDDARKGYYGAVVPLENSGWCRFDVKDTNPNPNYVNVYCWDTSGDYKHRVTAHFNWRGNREVRLHDP